MSEEHEEWRAVVGYEGLYEVSDHGRVRSIDRVVPDSRGCVRRLKGVTLKRQTNSVNHVVEVQLCRLGHVTCHRVSTLVAAAFHGPRPEGYECCHNNGDASDNRASNLRWDTHWSNIQDKFDRGTDYQTNKTVCPRGHLLVVPNITAWARRVGFRCCLACSRATSYVQKHPDMDRDAVADRYYEAIMRDVDAA